MSRVANGHWDQEGDQGDIPSTTQPFRSSASFLYHCTESMEFLFIVKKLLISVLEEKNHLPLAVLTGG
jgi:hypothetical protein